MLHLVALSIQVQVQVVCPVGIHGSNASGKPPARQGDFGLLASNSTLSPTFTVMGSDTPPQEIFSESVHKGIMVVRLMKSCNDQNLKI